MFLTFVSTPSTAPSTSKGRSRIKHACEHCRVFRVRCDGQQPCARCRTQRRRCLYSPRSPRNNAPKQHQQQHQPPAPPAPSPSPDSSAPPPASLSPSPAPASAPASAPDPPPDAVDPLSPDSATAFAAKINHYFSSIAAVVPEQVLDSPPPPQYSAFASTLQCADQPPLHLTSPQRSALLRLYVRRLHQAAPIVCLEQLRALCHNENPPPLLCAVFALAIQHAACSGLASRVLDLAIPAIAASPDASLAGYELIARCRGSLAGDSLDPSITDVQCHVLMALYLVNAGQLKAAYNLLGSAVRTAYCLDLHHPAPGRSDELCRRLWWSLVQLDLKCACLLARPAAFRRSDMSCPFPADSRREWSLHVHSVKLTAAVLSASRANARPDSADDWNLGEAHARSFADQLGPVLEWEASVRQSTLFFDIELDPEETMAAFFEEQQDPISLGQDECSMQRVLLKIHYHNSLMGLLRSFIHFPFRSISPVRSPGVDKHATAAIAHALALAATVVDSFQRSDLLYGWCDIYQSLWNALLTMAGFILSYPFCRYSCKSRRLFPKAIAIFDMISPRISTAARFAALGKDLLSRIERLVAFVEEKQREKEELPPTKPTQPSSSAIPSLTSSESVSDTPGDFEVQAVLAAAADPEGSHADQQTLLNYDPAAATACDQEMWSWMDIVDPPNWPDYRDGVDQLFTDITDLDLLMEEPWRGVQQ